MEITEEIKASIDSSVLCWLATVSGDNMPNVSPKEVFACYEEEIIIANIASPQTVRNIKGNENVCIINPTVIKRSNIRCKALTMN